MTMIVVTAVLALGALGILETAAEVRKQNKSISLSFPFTLLTVLLIQLALRILLFFNDSGTIKMNASTLGLVEIVIYGSWFFAAAIFAFRSLVRFWQFFTFSTQVSKSLLSELAKGWGHTELGQQALFLGVLGMVFLIPLALNIR